MSYIMSYDRVEDLVENSVFKLNIELENILNDKVNEESIKIFKNSTEQILKYLEERLNKDDEDEDYDEFVIVEGDIYDIVDSWIKNNVEFNGGINMKLELNGNKLSVGDKEIKLTDEQLKEMGIYLEPFDIHYGDKIFYIKTSGDIGNTIFNSYCNNHTRLLKSGKICRDEELMKQKALRQNLNDLLWQFTNENGWSEEVWEDVNKGKCLLRYDYEDREVIISYNYGIKAQGTTYFISEEIAQRAIDEIVKPYMEEHPEFVW